MSRPAISIRQLSDTLSLSERYATSEHKQGFWLYDTTRGMNLAMGAPTAEAALVEALVYYQKRLTRVEDELRTLRTQVDAFVDQFKGTEEEW